MSAPKKTTKATKSPAPASKETKANKPAAKKASAKVTAPAKAATPAAKASAATASIIAAVTRAAAPVLVATASTPPAAVKEVTRTPVRTTIAAKIDIGFGNTLYVRGEGPGLSWDAGVPMANVGADLWQLELGEANRPFTFKFLVNDLTWNVGADFTVAVGESVTFTPEF